MGFESGAVSFRWYHLPHPLPDDAIERLAAHAAPPLDLLQRHPMTSEMDVDLFA